MYVQWRSIVLSILVIVQGSYFGTVYVALQRSQASNQDEDKSEAAATWAACMVLNGGDKTKCLQYSEALGLNQSVIVASLFMASLIGILTFCLMVRRSMITGWWELLKDPRSIRFNRKYSGQRSSSRRKSALKRPAAGVQADSEKKLSMFDTPMGLQPDREPTGVLPDPESSIRAMSIPEAGDVSQRHETTNLFEEGDDDEDDVVVKKTRRRAGDDDDSDLV